jgi:hypothetical protein
MLACRLQIISVMLHFICMRSLRLAVPSSAALMLCACADPRLAPFSEIDLDGDGRISQQEATHDVVLDQIFVDFDLDGDGELTPFEYIKAASRRR